MAPRKAQAKKDAGVHSAGPQTIGRVTRSQTAGAAPAGPVGVKKPAAKPAPRTARRLPPKKKNQRGGKAKGRKQGQSRAAAEEDPPAAGNEDGDDDDGPPRAPGRRARGPSRPERRAAQTTRPAAAAPSDDEEGDDDRPRGRDRTPRTPPVGSTPSPPAQSSPAQDARSSEERYDAPTEAQLALEQREELAMVQASTDCTFRENAATLTVKLQVHKDPNDYTSRLGYRARLALNHSVGDNQEQEDAGYIISWRISKPTAVHPNVSDQNFRREILTPSTDRPDPEIRETRFCMKALYTQQGVPKAQFRNTTVGDQLANNSLLFIEMIYIRPAFARQGLLRHALGLYHEMLGALPEWYACAGTIVLVPSRPESVKGYAWGEMDDDEVEGLLRRAYEGSGGYVVLARDVNVSGRAITVMGRTVPVGNADAAAGDDADADANQA